MPWYFTAHADASRYQLVVSLIMTCAFDEVAAPHAHFHSSCYKFVGLAATLRECISLCGPDAAPVCPTSDDENDFVWSVARSGRYVESIWLGWHKNESGSLSSCVSEGADAEYADATRTHFSTGTLRGSCLKPQPDP